MSNWEKLQKKIKKEKLKISSSNDSKLDVSVEGKTSSKSKRKSESKDSSKDKKEKSKKRKSDSASTESESEKNKSSVSTEKKKVSDKKQKTEKLKTKEEKSKKKEKKEDKVKKEKKAKKEDKVKKEKKEDNMEKEKKEKRKIDISGSEDDIDKHKNKKIKTSTIVEKPSETEEQVVPSISENKEQNITDQKTEKDIFNELIGSGDDCPKTPEEWYVALARAEKCLRLLKIKAKFDRKTNTNEIENSNSSKQSLDISNLDKVDSEKLAVPVENRNAIGKYLAIDCEMVGVGPKGCRSILARVSIVNFYGVTVIDKYAKPTERVTDYRTWVSGVRPKDLENAEPFDKVQQEVANLIKDRILVGHAISNDMKALKLYHPPSLTRDTSFYIPFKNHVNGKVPGLKKLSAIELGLTIQEGEHSSVIDAQITMLLYRKVRSHWDLLFKKKVRAKNKRIQRAVQKKEVWLNGKKEKNEKIDTIIEVNSIVNS
ncbi:hypothetical protein BB558_006742 [Smittium angustum]|uniref:RNA exonuclease 4 n=1 Tax=Smittium angustum TaxID=133377 RepID=A0A2U1IX03_SMIAN|nr:hypothetical protein BB558_007249 [Smittium angustum]PVZ97313.1 hypothetical protein BB558_006742 [Smittium angustum]